MINAINRKIFAFFAFIITTLAVFTVNSTCVMGLGQELEPESLKRLKKIN